MDEDRSIHYDELLKSLRWKGFYQKSRCLFLLLPTVTIVFHEMSVIFIGKTPNHRCRHLENLNLIIGNTVFLSNVSDVSLNVTYSQCSVDVSNGSDVIFTTSCLDGYEYDEPETISFVSEWNLVCDKELMSDHLQLVYMLGEMFGSLFLTRLSDTHGRKRILVFSSLIAFVTTTISSFPYNYTAFLILKFISGIFIALSAQVSYIIFLEMMPAESRSLAEAGKQLVIIVSMFILCFVSFMTQQWHFIQLILSLLSVYVLVLYWYVDESLAWLFTVNKQMQAEEMIGKICKINEIEPQQALELYRRIASIQHRVETIGDKRPENETTELKSLIGKEKENLLAFFRNKTLMRIAIKSCLMSFCIALSSQGLTMISPSLTSNFYLGFALGTAADFPALLLFCILINRLGRKKCLNMFYLISGIVLLTSIPFQTSLTDEIPGKYWINLVLSVAGRFSTTLCSDVVSLYSNELFPTCVRNTGCGLTGAAVYFGILVAPYTRTLARHVPWAPNVVFGVICMVAPLAVISLPETRGRELPQTLKDLDARSEESQEYTRVH